MADINDPYPRSRQSPSVAITEWCRYDRLPTLEGDARTNPREDREVADQAVGNSQVAGGGVDVL